MHTISVDLHITCLLNAGLPELVVHSFTRHKPGTIIERYHVARFVGLNGERTELSRVSIEEDKYVFRFHPWLKLWSERR
jgi:hypothetical protein